MPKPARHDGDGKRIVSPLAGRASSTLTRTATGLRMRPGWAQMRAVYGRGVKVPHSTRAPPYSGTSQPHSLPNLRPGATDSPGRSRVGSARPQYRPEPPPSAGPLGPSRCYVLSRPAVPWCLVGRLPVPVPLILPTTFRALCHNQLVEPGYPPDRRHRSLRVVRPGR